MKSALRLAATLVCTAAISACSSTDDPPTGQSPTTRDSGTGGGTSDAAAGAKDGGAALVDAASDAAVVNACTAFVDHTASGDARAVTWDFPIATSAERCLAVKVGQTVTWKGNFNVHPLKGGSGTSPNPVDGVGADGKVTFTAEGTYGFHCDIHPAMIGAVRVIP